MTDLVQYDAASRTDWASLIRASWRDSVNSIIETGRRIEAAKANLEHGEFEEMVGADLPFGARTAERLMKISADPRISNPTHASLLPPHWGTLYELTKYSDEQFEAKIADGTIRPDMERREVINGARSIMGSRQEPDDSLDYFPTPPWATRALMQLALPWACAKHYESVWEPAAGEGHIAEVLSEYFPCTISSDVFDYGRGDSIEDFLKDDRSRSPDWIITNPPFGDKTEAFVLKALEITGYGVAMFVRLQWLESVGRYESIFNDHPPTLIAFFAERVNLCKGRWDPKGTTATAYIWVIWIKGEDPQAPYWIPPGQREALTHPDDAARFTAHPVIKKQNYNPTTGEIAA